jgi:hypothetical protein
MNSATLGRVVGLAFVCLAVGLIVVGLIKLTDAANLALGAIVGFGAKLILWPERVFGRQSDVELTMKALNIGSLAHLTIHYSERTDEARKPTVPYYVVNNNTKQAYWVREELRELNKRKLIQGATHFGKEELIKYLGEHGIRINDRYSKGSELLPT